MVKQTQTIRVTKKKTCNQTSQQHTVTFTDVIHYDSYHIVMQNRRKSLGLRNSPIKIPQSPYAKYKQNLSNNNQNKNPNLFSRTLCLLQTYSPGHSVFCKPILQDTLSSANLFSRTLCLLQTYSPGHSVFCKPIPQDTPSSANLFSRTLCLLQKS